MARDIPRAADATAAKVDFRSRVAAEKRDRMRARLLAATMEACAKAGGPGGAVIDDVVRAAGVSRGAFYRYFPSLDEAVAALVSDMTAEIVATARAMFADVDDPVLGSAIGAQLLLYRAAMDRPWAGFVSSTSLILDAPPLLAVVGETLAAGRARGAFSFESLSTATDAFNGGLLAGVRRLSTREGPPGDYVTELSRLILRSLGASDAAADAAARQARARIEAVAPARLAWWRPA